MPYLGWMKVQKWPLALSLVGAALLLTGIAFKLNHLMGAELLSNVGFAALVLGLVWLASKVVRS
mgnify:CR=1 FL=1